MSDKKKMNKAIVKVCKRLWARNMLASADGNVSYRLSDDRVHDLLGVAEAILSDVARGVYECTRYENS